MIPQQQAEYTTKQYQIFTLYFRYSCQIIFEGKTKILKQSFLCKMRVMEIGQSNWRWIYNEANLVKGEKSGEIYRKAWRRPIYFTKYIKNAGL